MVIERGELIHTELPWIYSVNEDLKDVVCDYCLCDTRLALDQSTAAAEVKTITLCENCRQVGYCSKECQANALANLHGQECRYLAQISKLYADEQRLKSFYSSMLYPRMLLQTILRLENRQDSVIAAVNSANAAEPMPVYVPNNKNTTMPIRKFKDLKSHWSELSQDKDLIITLNTTARALHTIINSAMTPEEHSAGQIERLTRYLQPSSIGELFGRVKTNALTIEAANLEPIGQALYLQTSYFDHSCQPNAYISFGALHGGATARVVATRRIDRIEDVRIAYCPVLLPRQHRHELLLRQYFFTCECPACISELYNALMLALKCPQCAATSTANGTDEAASVGKIPIVLPVMLQTANDDARQQQPQNRIASMPCTKCSHALDQQTLQTGINQLMNAMEISRTLRQQQQEQQQDGKQQKNQSNNVNNESAAERYLHATNYYVSDTAHSKAMQAFYNESNSLVATNLLQHRVLPFYEARLQDQPGVGEMEYFVKLAQLVECNEHAAKQQQASNDADAKLLSEDEVKRIKEKVLEILKANVGSETIMFQFWSKKLNL